MTDASGSTPPPVSPPTLSQTSARAGALWMILSGVGAAGMAVSVRMLSQDLPSPMIVCLRSVFGLAVLAPLLVNGRLFRLGVSRPRLHLLRGLAAAAALNLGFYSMSAMPLTTATILFFLAPIFATLIAAVVLKEQVGVWRWSAVIAGFIGTLIVVRPGIAPLNLAMLAAIGSSVLFAGQLILAKTMSRDNAPTTIFATTIMVAAIGTIPPALPFWSLPPDLLAWTVLAGVIAGSSLRMYADIRAYAVADAGYLAPFSFLRLVFVALGAWALFGETPDAYDLLGGGVIVGASLVIAHREARRRRLATP